MPIRLPIIGSDRTYLVHPSKIIAVGLNYRAHIAESESVRVRGMDGDIPLEPILFAKTPNVLIGHGDPIPIPGIIRDYDWRAEARTDYEGELVAVIGKSGRDIRREDALDFVYGYTCGNDVSQRNVQNSDKSGWFRGKSFDGFGPVGPEILPADGVDPQKFDLTTRLNGQVVQSASTSLMIFPVDALIAYISKQVTLEDGDLIFTGTPSGVGPLAAGDRVEVEISGIGVLANPVIDEAEGGLR